MAFLLLVLMMDWRELKQQHQQSYASEYQPITEAAQTQAKLLFQKTFTTPNASELTSDWAQLGMRYEQKGPFYILREQQLQGRGFFVFRDLTDSALVLEVPHSKFDQGTGTLGVQLFCQGKIRAAAFNTTSRYTKMGKHTADMAHFTPSYFQAFHLAWLDVSTQGLSLQIHGYSKGKRNTAAGKTADMVLSSTLKSPQPWVYPIYSHLKELFGPSIKLFGENVYELGGTKNEQGRQSRYQGRRFLHLEMSKEMRTALKKSRQKRKQLLTAFSEQ